MDWTISFSDVVLFGGGILTFLKIFLSMRDMIRDLTTVVGKDNPPSGLVGEIRTVRTQQSLHHEWLVDLRARDRFARTRVDDPN